MPASSANAARQRSLVWVDRVGREEALTADPAPYHSPRIAPGGRRVVMEIRNPDDSDLVVYHLDDQNPVRLTFDRANDLSPVWSHDGRQVLFSSDRGGGDYNIYGTPADGSGQIDRLTTSENRQFLTALAGGGETLVILDLNQNVRPQLGRGAEPAAAAELTADRLRIGCSRSCLHRTQIPPPHPTRYPPFRGRD